jgi:cell division protease FtsH
LRRVTDIAHSMVTRYGMSERLGGVAYDREPQSFLTGPGLPSPHREESYAEETAALIDHEVRNIVETAMNRALDILRQRREVLERGARRLLEKETLDDRDLAELIGSPPRSPVQVAAE